MEELLKQFRDIDRFAFYLGERTEPFAITMPSRSCPLAAYATALGVREPEVDFRDAYLDGTPCLLEPWQVDFISLFDNEIGDTKVVPVSVAREVLERVREGTAR